MRRVLSLAALTFTACNAYHVLSLAARLALTARDATMFDDEAFAALIAECD